MQFAGGEDLNQTLDITEDSRSPEDAVPVKEQLITQVTVNCHS